LNINLSSRIFSDPTAAIDYLEWVRWGRNGIRRRCPKCDADPEYTARTGSKNHRYGLYYCNGCKATFTVTIGTIFQSSKVPLNKWLLLIHLMTTAKKGASALQLERQIGVSYNTAWSMCHRIREAMKPTEAELKRRLGGPGKIVETDETYWGNNGKLPPGARGWGHKMKIVTVVERGGSKRSFHVPNTKAKTVLPLVKQNVDRRTRMMTDESSIYNKLGWDFASHETVNHRSREYARGDVNTNTVESSFAVLKRSFRGTFHQMSEKHLHRYLVELDYKWNHRDKGPGQMLRTTVKRAEGKRLTGWALKNARSRVVWKGSKY